MSETTTTDIPTVNQTTCRHIGPRTIMGISGGRIGQLDENTIELPVHYGYRVQVEYLPGQDLYEVRRMLKRGAKMFDKGTETGLYADQLEDSAYRASCFQNVEFGR